VLRWLGYEIQPFRFVIAGVVVLTAILLVQRQRRKAGRRNH
jgi:hypothetical protein